MSIFYSNEPRGPDPYLGWKTLLFGIGAIIGLGGIFSGRDWLIPVAIIILAVGVVLRIIGRRKKE